MKHEPLGLQRAWIDEMHRDQIRLHGGFYGVRDDGLIESALARPRDKWAYEEPDIFDLAAAYGFGLSSNHGYVDGNKRIAFVAMAVFLDLNGNELLASEPEVVDVMLRLAAGRIPEGELASWLRENVTAV